MKKKVNFYFFTNSFDNIITENIIKIKPLSIIYKPINKNYNLHDIDKLSKFCKKFKILFYLTDNYKLSVRYKADGIFLSSNNKNKIHLIYYRKRFNIIGLAHNHLEYFNKLKQNCMLIMLSPLFYNKKYSTNNILGINKFNLIAMNWKRPVCALGGISYNFLKKIKMTKAIAVGFISLMFRPIIKKPVYFL